MLETERPTGEADIILGCVNIGGNTHIIGYDSLMEKPVQAPLDDIPKIFSPEAAQSVAIFLQTEHPSRNYNDGQLIIPDTVRVGKIIDQRDSSAKLNLDYIEIKTDEAIHRVDEKTLLQALLDSLEKPFTETRGNPRVANELLRHQAEELFLPIISLRPQYQDEGPHYLVCSIPNDNVGISNYQQIYRTMLLPVIRELLLNDLMQDPAARKGYVAAAAAVDYERRQASQTRLNKFLYGTPVKPVEPEEIIDESEAMMLADRMLFQDFQTGATEVPVLEKETVVALLKGMLTGLDQKLIDQLPTPQRVAVYEKRRLEHDFGTDIDVPDAPWYITDEFIERARGMGFALAYFPALDSPTKGTTSQDDFMRHIRTQYPHWLEPNQYEKTHDKADKSYGIVDQYWQAIYNRSLSFQKNGFWGVFEMRDEEGYPMSRTRSKARISRLSNEYSDGDGSHKLLSELGLLGRGWVCVPDVYQINLMYNQEARKKTQWRQELTSSRSSNQFRNDSVVYYSGISLGFVEAGYNLEFSKDDYRLLVKLGNTTPPAIESHGGDGTT